MTMETTTERCPFCEQELSTEAAARMAERDARQDARRAEVAVRMEARIARLQAEGRIPAAGSA
jgi:putative heme iron utilization protein